MNAIPIIKISSVSGFIQVFVLSEHSPCALPIESVTSGFIHNLIEIMIDFLSL
jgi:hypothetical protein